MNKVNQINIIKIIYRSLFSAEGLPQLIINCVFIHNYGIIVLMIARTDCSKLYFKGGPGKHHWQLVSAGYHCHSIENCSRYH